MRGISTSDPEGPYAAYRRQLLGERAVPAVRVGALVVLATNLAFVWLDHHEYPELFWDFFAARMALNAVLFVLSVWSCHRFPEASQVALGGATGLLLLYVVHGSGLLGGYYVGLLLLFSGLPMLLPLSTLQNLMLCGGLTGGYAVLLIASPEARWDQYAINLLFLGSAAFISVLNCQQLNKWRFTDFQQRAEIEGARDRLAALDEAKARFSANVHHELRTPLTLILAPLDALRGGEFGELSAVVEKTLRTMHINGQRLLKMINNLLDLAKVESRSFEIHRRPMDLEKLVRDVVDGAEDLARRKGLSLSVELPPDGVRHINADPDALEKVVMNLLGNALKFTEAGGSIRVSLEQAPEVDGYDGVRVAVTDTGVGLSPEQLDRVFDRFSQVDNSATRKHEGTGIGLSLAFEMVELHGGRIWAESDGPGCGTSMIFLLPVGEVDEALEEEVICDEEGRGLELGSSIRAMEGDLGLTAAEPGENARFAEMERSVRRWEGQGEDAQEAGASAAVLPGDAPEVLVVEDNPDMRELLLFLVGREFRTRAARNGREALERVAERLPDLVLTDVMMPEMSGTELCRELKTNPETSAVPVVLVTSKAEGEMKVEGLELGADDYVTKPFHPRELMARVRSLVTQRCLRLELAGRNAELEAAMKDLEQAQVQLVQSERLAAVGELAAGIAHEVNNPVNFALNAVRAMKASVLELQELGACVAAIDWQDDAKRAAQIGELAALAERLGVEDLTETVAELSGIIGEGLTRTHSLVGDLRDFAAPGARGEHTRVDVKKGLKSTAELLRHLLRDAGAELVLDLPAVLPAVRGDPGALNQVFLNLVKNAAESLAGGGGSIRVEASTEGGMLRVCVRDDGSGMPPEVMARLFEPFFTTKDGGRGTGLGLSICKQIVEGHGGTLEVESAEGKGTTMTVSLPVEAVGDDRAA